MTVVEVTVVEVTVMEVTVMEVAVVEMTVVEVQHHLVSPTELRDMPGGAGPPGRLQHWLEDWSSPGGEVKDYHTLFCVLCTWGYGEARYHTEGCCPEGHSDYIRNVPWANFPRKKNNGFSTVFSVFWIKIVKMMQPRVALGLTLTYSVFT